MFVRFCTVLFLDLMDSLEISSDRADRISSTIFTNVYTITGVIGGLFIGLPLIVLVTVFVWCCCCRNRNSRDDRLSSDSGFEVDRIHSPINEANRYESILRHSRISNDRNRTISSTPPPSYDQLDFSSDHNNKF